MIDLSTLPDPIPTPDVTTWSHQLQAYMSTGLEAVDTVRRHLLSAPACPVAIDIETAGLGAKAFQVKCVTLAWEHRGTTYTVLLDPRDSTHGDVVRKVTHHASLLVLHNAAFDWPVLYQYGLVTMEDTAKVWDTVVAGRMAFPDRADGKDLTSLATRSDLLGMVDNTAGMPVAFKAAGYTTQSAGWEHMDIDSPVYRLGAMADTVLTLRLAPLLLEAVVAWTTSNPYEDVSRQWALELLEREQTTNRVMLRVSARGLLVDTEYLEAFSQQHSQELEQASADLTAAGLDPQAGNLGAKLVEYLASRGELPAGWPVTETGRPKADKAAIARLDDHPLAVAQRKVAELSKVTGYLEKVDGYARVTGRVHPQVGVLGASATGRMAYREPELQQFPDQARRILVPDPGRDWVSIDWSSIEPVVVANCAGDREFLAGFDDHGADLYAPIVANAGVDRKTAKVVLLAAMYGQGRALLAKTLGTSEQEAAAVQAKVFESMPATDRFLNALRKAGEQRGVTMTADFRLLPVPKDKRGAYMGYKATNYFTQGTAYSVLSHTINALDRAGLGDSIYLAMHDELVVDSAVASQVREFMETPPEWLEKKAGKRVVLRTDSNPLNGAWRYV